MAETLSQKQQRFTVMIAQLILWADSKNYGLTFAEAYRTPEQAALNAKRGIGIANSLHTKRLAVDFNLFNKTTGQYLTTTKDHEPLGLFWESIGGTWGGRFRDGNHYSLAHEGVK